MVMKIGVVYNACPEELDPANLHRRRTESTAALITNIFHQAGHSCAPFPLTSNLSLFLQKIENFKPDLIFNLFTGKGYQQILMPALLEWLNIPYTGSDILTHCLALNKPLAKQIFEKEGIPTPPWRVIKWENKTILGNFNFPLLVKPVKEGSSRGIKKENLIENRDHLEKLVYQINKKWHQATLVEDFIMGREFTIGVLGNEILPIMELNFINVRPKEKGFYYKEIKDEDEEIEFICPALLDDNQRKEIKKRSLAAYQALECRDYARVDMRMSSEGKIYILEVNTLPGLHPGYSLLPRMAELGGISYSRLITRIFDLARIRYQLVP